MGALTLWDGPVRLWLHRMDEVWKLMCILNKKYRRIVADQIEDPLFGIEFGGETANITHGICRTRAALHRREADKDRGDLLRVAEEIRFGNILQALVGLKVAVGRRAASVDDTLWNALVVKVGDLLPQDKILQQRRAAIARA